MNRTRTLDSFLASRLAQTSIEEWRHNFLGTCASSIGRVLLGDVETISVPSLPSDTRPFVSWMILSIFYRKVGTFAKTFKQYIKRQLPYNKYSNRMNPNTQMRHDVQRIHQLQFPDQSLHQTTHLGFEKKKINTRKSESDAQTCARNRDRG